MERPVYMPLNHAVVSIAARLFPCGYDVAGKAPESLEELTAHLTSTGIMLVWDGESDHTVFGDREINWAFRAWHDFHHWRGQLPFTLAGEIEVAKRQIDDVRKVYGRGPVADKVCAMVWTEVAQPARHHHHNGTFPQDQRAFAAAYLPRSAGEVRALSL